MALKIEPRYILAICYENLSQDVMPFARFADCRDFYRDKISYSGGRVKRVEVHFQGSVRVVWDSAWDNVSKHAGLNAYF